MKKEWWGLLALTTFVVSELAFSRPQRLKIGSLYKWKCQGEGCERRFQDGYLIDIDHEIPLSKGGKDVISNGKPKCLWCHLKKHEDEGDVEASRLIRLRLKATGGRTIKWKLTHKK